MYDELVKRLRELPHLLFVQLHGHEDVVYKAADAIEKLSRECKVLYAMLGTHPDPRGELGDSGESQRRNHDGYLY